MQLLRSQQWKALLQIESHLIAKHRNSACACAVAFLHPFFQDAVKQVKIWFHDVVFFNSFAKIV
jgi:hypothetical protein